MILWPCALPSLVLDCQCIESRVTQTRVFHSSGAGGLGGGEIPILVKSFLHLKSTASLPPPRTVSSLIDCE